MDRFQEAKLQVKERVDLVDLVQTYVPLRRRGRNMVGLCPFHQEKTPSFTVFPDSQHYRCFGCSASGDVFTFVQEREGLTFRDAFEMLAQRAGVSTDGVFGGGSSAKPRGPDPHEALAQIRDLFEETLFGDAGRPAREYLEGRGLLDAADSFGLGAHPPTGLLRDFAKQRRLPTEVLEQAGLLRRDGREPMDGRVMFPISDERGRIVGFGGRVLPPAAGEGERRPKYLNSPEAAFFNKRRVLYGLRQVKQSGARRVVVVEGYTDVIACHLAGFTGAVATLGTALTREHARLLERYATDGVVLLFDGDQAGRRAVDRAFRELVHTNLPVEIALLPDGVDPADLAAVGPGREPAEVDAARAALTELITGADDALTVWFRLLRRNVDLTVPANVARVAEDCGRILAEVDVPARRSALRARMAMNLGLKPAELPIPEARRPARDGDARAPRTAPSAQRPAPARPPQAPASPIEKADLELIGCILAEPGLAAESGNLSSMSGPKAARVLEAVAQALAAGRTTAQALIQDLFARFTEDPELRTFLAEACERSARLRDPRSIFSTLRRDRELLYVRQKAADTKRLAMQALAQGDTALADRLTRDFHELMRQSDRSSTV